ncbi:MAG: molybdopterin-binding protein [Betaproteobacteria bacterium]|nr:molybdopterin-binding protein [Betaproteobacteria bacterium]
MGFGAFIIGDEILFGKREDQHFRWLAGALAARGLRLSWLTYLGDNEGALTAAFRRSFVGGDTVFSFGGIGNTPDDRTRQAVAAALGVPLIAHPQGEAMLHARFCVELGIEITPERRLLITFPEGCDLIPNPVNRIPGFHIKRHYFVPGFPQMAYPMLEWALDTFHHDEFGIEPRIERALLLTGPDAHESGLLGLMEQIVAAYPDLRLFSLPSHRGTERIHLELGVEGAPERVEEAMAEILREVERRNIGWRWRE